MKRLAILGGRPAFPDGMPLTRPATPPLERVMELVRPSYDSGQLTNGVLVRRLEEAAVDRLGVEHVVAVSSCTAGLMLVVRALDLAGPVVLPSFTFSASAHALAWNGVKPLFAECDGATFQVDVADAASRLLAGGAAAVLATHCFGAPCDTGAVEQAAAGAGVPAIFDAAHAFGARRGDRPVGGFGVAEVFSLTATKPLVSGEGGLVATNDAQVAEAVRLGRDYGNPGDYDTRFAGLNARMSELHAAVAVAGLEGFDDALVRRRFLADRYRRGLAEVPGVTLQAVDARDQSTYKDLTVRIDPDRFGLPRDEVRSALAADGVETRAYFDPPVHRQQAYAGTGASVLPATEALAKAVVSLPLFPGMADDAVDQVVDLMAALHQQADEVAARLSR